MTITGHTRVFMIVGDPVAQVRAPEVCDQLFARHGIDAVLVPMKVAPATLAGAVNAARRADDGAVEGALDDGVGFVKGLDHCGRPTPADGLAQSGFQTVLALDRSGRAVVKLSGCRGSPASPGRSTTRAPSSMRRSTPTPSTAASGPRTGRS